MKKYSILLLFSFCLAQAQTVYIIIHGTWCTPFQWHMPGGDFFEALQNNAKKCDSYVGFLQWPGKNSYTARIEGAYLLANLIKTFKPDDTINLIGHSHGGNVAILASQLLHKTNYHINHIFLLGTPINPIDYKPNMHQVNKVFSLFSFGDIVQTVGGLFKKTLPPTKNCHNIRIEINGSHPNHCAMHSSMIAALIPSANFWNQFDYKNNYVIEFEDGKIPQPKIDGEREKYQAKMNLLLTLYNDPLRKVNSRGFLPSDPKPH